MWVIYEHPADYPHGYVVRRWSIDRDGATPHEAQRMATLGGARKLCLALWPPVVRVMRYPEDEPQIVEVWM